jgi:hypothetical protein
MQHIVLDVVVQIKHKEMLHKHVFVSPQLGMMKEYVEVNKNFTKINKFIYYYFINFKCLVYYILLIKILFITHDQCNNKLI